MVQVEPLYNPYKNLIQPLENPYSFHFLFHSDEEALGIFLVVLDAAFVCLDRLAQRYLLQAGFLVLSTANASKGAPKCEAAQTLWQ